MSPGRDGDMSFSKRKKLAAGIGSKSPKTYSPETLRASSSSILRSSSGDPVSDSPVSIPKNKYKRNSLHTSSSFEAGPLLSSSLPASPTSHMMYPFPFNAANDVNNREEIDADLEVKFYLKYSMYTVNGWITL